MKTIVSIKSLAVTPCAMLVNAVTLLAFAGSGAFAAQPLYTVTGVGTLGGVNSDAYGINSSGDVVGRSETPDGWYRGFVYSGGQIHDLGTLGGPISFAYDINDAGQVVGHSWTSTSDTHAFLYSGGSMGDLGAPVDGASFAESINNSG